MVRAGASQRGMANEHRKTATTSTNMRGMARQNGAKTKSWKAASRMWRHAHQYMARRGVSARAGGNQRRECALNVASGGGSVGGISDVTAASANGGMA